MSSDITFKVVIFGDGGVGKTTLVKRYLTGLFNGDTRMTIGINFHLKKLEIDGQKVLLQIWDLAGEAHFREILHNFVKGAKGGIFMYDITRYSSLKDITEWLNILKEGTEGENEEMPLIMVGGKLDLEFKRTVSRKYGIETARYNGFQGFIECSAKTGENVEVAFKTLARIMMEKANLI